MTRHVVFGTGQVGRHVVEQLVSHGIEVTAVNAADAATSPAPKSLPVTPPTPAFTSKVCSAPDAVYFCLNAANCAEWASEFPPLQRGVLAGAPDSSCWTTCTPPDRPAAGHWSRPCRSGRVRPRQPPGQR